MAKKTKSKSGEPPRISVPKRGAKPFLVVADDSGLPVMQQPYYLAWHKATGVYYVGGTDPRIYLKTRDRLQAIFRFREWVRVHNDDWQHAYVTLEHEPHRHQELSEPIHLVDVLDGDRRFVRYDIPAGDFWRLVREAALSEPDIFRKETGLRVIDHGMTESATLEDVLNTYLNKRKKPCDEEIKKVLGYWRFFVSAIAPAKQIVDVDAEALTRWEDAAHAKYENEGSPKTLAHRFEYVFRLFNFAVKKQLDVEECKRVLAEITSAKAELPGLRNPNPKPISVDDFHALLGVADEKWTAILLLALNLSFYPIDVRTITKSAMDLKTGMVIFDRAKTGQTTRVGVLWSRTVSAIRAYLKSSGHNQSEVFITQYGRPYTAQGFRNVFRLQRTKAGLDSEVEFAHIRDGAYSAAIQGGVSETMAKILAGHKISGMSDAYIKRNPKMVAEACELIEQHYFG